MERDRTFPCKVQRFSELAKMRLSPAHYRAAVLERGSVGWHDERYLVSESH